jgi:iron(III) transport system permease protein
VKIKELISKNKTLFPIALLLGLIAINLVLPMLSLLEKAFDYSPAYEGFVNEFTNVRTRTAIFNSVWVSAVAAFAAVALAFFFAFIVQFKMRERARRFFRFFAIMPMLVPSITYGIVIIYLFGRQGIFTRLLDFQLPIYGPLGIIMGSFFYAFPIAFLLLSQAFSNIDNRCLEAAITLGGRSFARFKDIVLPITKYAVFSAFAVCFTVIMTDYGIALSVGTHSFETLSVLFYRQVVGASNFSRGAIFGTFILVPAIAIFLLDIFYFSKKQLSSSHNIRPVPKSKIHPLQIGGFIVIVLVIVIPLIVICIAPFVKGWPFNPEFTLDHFTGMFENARLRQMMWNSVYIAFLSGIIGMVIAFTAGYLYVRAKSSFGVMRKVMHVLYLVTLAIPGLAMGLGFVLFFIGTPIYNTIAILVIVNIVHFIGSPYMMVVSHFKLLNPNLEDICKSLGGKWYHNIKDVIIPNSKRVLLDSFVYLFTNSMITISAVSMLVSARTSLLSLQITAYNSQGDRESAIAVSLLIFAVNAAVKLWQTMSRASRS